MTRQQPDISPEAIRKACAEIQSTWTEAERLKRLRVDLRPVVMTADGRLLDVTLDAYDARAAMVADGHPEPMKLPAVLKPESVRVVRVQFGHGGTFPERPEWRMTLKRLDCDAMM